MSEKSKKKDKNQGIGKGTFGVGETLEEVKTLDAVDFLRKSEYYRDLTTELTPKEKEDILNQTAEYLKPYEKIFQHLAESLEDPEKRRKLAEILRKKFT